MSRFRVPQSEDELRAAGFLVGLFIVAFWAGAGISPNPQVVGLVAVLIGQRMLPSKKERVSSGESTDPPVAVDRSPNGDEPTMDRPRDRGTNRPWSSRLRQRPA